MKTVVKFHRDCKADMREFVLAVPGRERARRELLQTFLEEIRESLLKSRGVDRALKTLGASVVEGVAPRLYRWPYSELQVRFAVRFEVR
jgi:hypothetical protein